MCFERNNFPMPRRNRDCDLRFNEPETKTTGGNVIKIRVEKGRGNKSKRNTSELVNISKCTTLECDECFVSLSPPFSLFFLLFFPSLPAAGGRLSITNDEINQRKCWRHDSVKQIHELRAFVNRVSNGALERVERNRIEETESSWNPALVRYHACVYVDLREHKRVVYETFVIPASFFFFQFSIRLLALERLVSAMRK